MDVTQTPAQGYLTSWLQQ